MATAKKRTHKDGSVSYEIRVSLGRDISSKQILKYHTWEPSSGMTQRQIEKELERQKILFEEKCRSGQVLDTNTKFAEFAEKWLDSNKDIHSPAYQKRASALLVRINAGIGHLPIGKLRPNHLQEFYKNLAEAGIKKSNTTAIARNLADVLKEKNITRTALSEIAGIAPMTITAACHGKKISGESAKKIAQGLKTDINTLFNIDNKKEALSAKTILHHHRLISAILQAAVKQQMIYDNPARRVDPPKVQKKEAPFLDDKEALQVVEALVEFASLKWRTIMMLLIYSGMRRGELCGLLWTDVDFENKIIHITKSNQYLSERGIFEKGPKNESSNRVINLPSEMFDMFREYKIWQTEERLKMGDRWKNSGKVFTQENGLPMHPDSITGWTAEFREVHGLPYFTPHSLRHTSATLQIMAGVPVKVVSARLGHANQNTTNVIYSHAIQTADAMASEVLGDILKPPEQGFGVKTI